MTTTARGWLRIREDEQTVVKIDLSMRNHPRAVAVIVRCSGYNYNSLYATTPVTNILARMNMSSLSF